MRIAFLLGIVVVTLGSVPVVAATLPDPTGDLHNGTGGGANFTGFTHLDITGAEVTTTATDISFKINLAGDPVATDWGKYLIAIDAVAGGDPAGNGWSRPIGMSSGMDYFLGTWVDSGNGAELRSWNGSAWVLSSATYNPNPANLVVSKNTNSVTLTASLASMGLTPDSSFLMDVWSSGGGGSDSAVDALGNDNPSITDWGNPYNSGANVEAVQLPEPGGLTVASLGALAVLRRRKR